MQDDYGNVWTYRAKWAYLLAVVGALLAPVFYIIYISFNEHGFGARIYEFTFDWYRVVLGDTMLVASLEWTAYLALAVVVSAVPLGLMAAKFYKRTRHKVWFVTLMLLPLLLLQLVLIFLLILRSILFLTPQAVQLSLAQKVFFVNTPK